MNVRARCSRALVLVATLASFACGSTSLQTRTAPPSLRDTHELLNATLWVQTSAEYDALCRSTYRQARASLEAALADRIWTAALEQTSGYEQLPPAIVVDLDETILDNSRVEGRLVNGRTVYNETLWTEWAKRSEAPGVPGAVEFLQYAASRNVAVFYITNRDSGIEAETRTNLARLELPLPSSPDVVLTQGENGWTSSDKGTRRATVARDYRILLLVGDDLGDFVSGAKASLEARMKLAHDHAEFWGSRWILLPNPMYGSWNTALYSHDSSLKDPDVLRKKMSLLRGF